jgi:hypothetical protein
LGKRRRFGGLSTDCGISTSLNGIRRITGYPEACNTLKSVKSVYAAQEYSGSPIQQMDY